MLLNRYVLTSICVFLLFAGPVSGSRQKTETVPMKLWYDRPATNWMTSALPIGNGELGALFFGGIENEQILFNEKTLWTGSTTSRGAYQKFGDLWIQFDGMDDVQDYRRELSLDEAIGRVSYTSGGTHYLREYFASRPDEVIVIRLSTKDVGAKLNFSVSLVDGRPGSKQEITKDGISFRRKLDLLSYEAQLKVINEGGTLVAGGDRLTVNAAHSVTILLTAATNYDLSSATYVGEIAGQLHNRMAERLAKASTKGYEKLKSAHLEDYQALFNRVRFELKTEIPTVPTNELVRLHREEPYLDMLYFQYGRYLMIASSRGMNLPNNLQGIWNGDNAPPWECDIHSNINIQMNYWPAESCNLSECHQPFLRYIASEAQRPGGSWQQLARSENLRGWTVNTQSNIFGYTDWNINRPANAWYCTHLWKHYAYTQDLNYLRSVAYPVMHNTCEYWFDRLKPTADGTLLAPAEWSPEHGPWEDGVAYAQQLVWQLFHETMQAAQIMSKAGIPVDEDFTKKLLEKLNRLDNGVTIGAWGQIREWREDSEKLDTLRNPHRHLSQLIALYPGNQISYYKNSSYADAAKKTLESRGDLGTGWSRAWKIAAWARLQDGEHAYRLLKSALTYSTLTVISMDSDQGGVYENLFDSHPPFQIDGNFGATAGIAEMLLQSHQGFIHLLPALPSVWANGSISGLRAEGNFTLDIKWASGRLVQCAVTSVSGGECRIYYPGVRSLKVRSSQGKEIVASLVDGNLLSFPTVKGETYRFSQWK